MINTTQHTDAAAPLFTRGGTLYTGRTCTEGGRLGYTARKRCSRCGGAGQAEQWRHTGLTCYDCAGRGDLGLQFHPLYTADKLAKLNAAADKRAARAEAKRAAAAAQAEAEAAARREAFEAAHGALLARVAGLTDAIVVDIVGRARQAARLTDKQAALLVSLAERAELQAAQAAASAHVGTVGERIEVAVTVARVASFERTGFRGYPETVYVITMVDAAGNQIVSKTPRFSAEAGEAFTLRATVTEHGAYRDAAQTLVSRPARKEAK